MISRQSALFNLMLGVAKDPNKVHSETKIFGASGLHIDTRPLDNPDYFGPIIIREKLWAFNTEKAIKAMQAGNSIQPTPVKAGKLKMMFKGVEQKHIENLGNHLKAQKLIITFEEPDQIQDIYECNAIKGSCMSGKGDYMEIVADHAHGILVAKKGSKIVGRALVWQSRKGTMLLDRPYGGDEVRSALRAEGRKRGYEIRSGDSYNYHGFDGLKGKIFKIELKYDFDRYEFYPYMDTFKSHMDGYLVAGDGNNEMTQTDGTIEDEDSTMRVCDVDGCDSRFDSEYEGAYIEHIGCVCDGCTCYDDLAHETILESESVSYEDDQGNRYMTHQDNDEIIEIDGTFYHYDATVSSDESGEYYHQDDEMIVHIDDHGTFHIDDDEHVLFQDADDDEWHHMDDCITTESKKTYHEANDNLIEIDDKWYHVDDDNIEENEDGDYVLTE